MATRSTIALEFADGTVGQIYCHWDGYLSNNGKILLNHYMDPFKVRELIDLGDLSTLAPEIGLKHNFDGRDQVDWCMFYGRDRGDTGVVARYFKDIQDYFQNGQREEYNYILTREQGWLVAVDDVADFEQLNVAFLKEEIEA